mgnify:CR=1 FL=1
MKYIIVDWPESQEIYDFKSIYSEDCYWADDCVCFVPEDVWDLYRTSPDMVLDNN